MVETQLTNMSGRKQFQFPIPPNFDVLLASDGHDRSESFDAFVNSAIDIFLGKAFTGGSEN